VQSPGGLNQGFFNLLSTHLLKTGQPLTRIVKLRTPASIISRTGIGAEWKRAHEQRLIRRLTPVSHRYFHTCVQKIAGGIGSGKMQLRTECCTRAMPRLETLHKHGTDRIIPKIPYNIFTLVFKELRLRHRTRSTNLRQLRLE
jgi:hypothetical protein